MKAESPVQIRNLKGGMRIKICENPSFFSIIRRGALKSSKIILAGTIQTVSTVKYHSQRIYIRLPENCQYDSISFNIKDLRYVKELPHNIIKPELFNPEQLI